MFQEDERRIMFSHDFWIFLAISIPLTLATVGAWLLAIRNKGKAKRRTMTMLNDADNDLSFAMNAKIV